MKVPVFAVLDKLAKIMIILSPKVAKTFDPELALDLACKEVVPLSSVNIHSRRDLDSIRKKRFYFAIANVPGRRKQFYIFCCQTSSEREKWVERISYLSNLAIDVDTLQSNADLLRKKLFSATTLLKMNVGETLLENMLNGNYKKGSRKYREVKAHLNGYFEIWENVMSKKIQVHNELLSFADRGAKKVEAEEIAGDAGTKKLHVLNKVMRTIKHVRKDSIISAAARV